MNDNLKWLLLIPVVILAIALGYFIPKLLGDDDSGSSSPEPQNQALQLDIDAMQERIVTYEGVLTRAPGDAEAIKGLGDSYLEKGDIQLEINQQNEALRSYKSAVDYYRKYLAIDPAGVEVRIDLGLAYSKLYMPEIAVRELRSATDIAPTNQRAWHVLGYVLENNMGLTAEARVAWQRSYDIDPNSRIGQESKQFIDQLSQPLSTQVPVQ